MDKEGLTYIADIHLKPTKAIHQQLQGPLKNHGRAVSAFSRRRRKHHQALTSKEFDLIFKASSIFIKSQLVTYTFLIVY